MTTVAQRTVSRNDPCPCGSGRRFKDCHGSLRATEGVAAGAPAAAPARSRYRPAGDDWGAVDPQAHDRLGAMMELALKHQLEQRMREAERLYRAVLEEAPLTHDALHMLAVVRLGLGDFPEAERLLRSAMALRPSYPAIETNWALVRRSIASRDRRGIEIVSEHALPLLRQTLDAMQRARPAASSSPAGMPLHVAGPTDHGSDGAWAARRVGELLAPLAPTLWRSRDACAHAGGWRRIDRHEIDVASGRRPDAGAVVLTHPEFDTDDWLRDAIDRILVFAQASPPSLYLERLRHIAADGRRSLSLMFTSHAMARKFGCDAIVVPPPIDLGEFRHAKQREALHASSALRVAAAGQDGRRVVAADDAPLLEAVAVRAGTLALLDPGPLRYALGMLANVHCIARGDDPLGAFLAGCDLYLHRVRPWWSEDDGRVFFGAMALGVPVLCPRESIYAEYVDDGVDGWLVDDDASALTLIDALRADRTRIAGAGAMARAKTQRLFDPRTLGAVYVDAVSQWLRA